ncbi:hypothetical protein Avbf_15883 [Armadillidium vulgare]|nr:hypothetical protein Avbf_15883 [Armadillidium vulgare]
MCEWFSNKLNANRFKWFGCKIVNATDTTCTYPPTALTTNTSVWRHAAHDPGHDIIYFCDYSPKKSDMVCYSSTDGETWNVLPSYIGSLKGYDAATNKMYAWDKKQRALVSSEDGVNWALVDDSVKESLSTTVDDTVKSLPGYPKADFTSVSIGPWTDNQIDAVITFV